MRTSLFTRRALLRAGAAAAAAAVAGCSVRPVTTSPARLRLVGEATLAHRLLFKDTIVGGLSALDHDPATGLWAALSDDRSELSPARFYTLQVELSGARLAVRLQDVALLRQPDGSTFPSRRAGGDVVDPEGMRLLPQGRIVWSSEGDFRSGQAPAVREARLDGSFVRQLRLPPLLDFVPGGQSGARNNLTLEGLAMTPDQTGVWAAMEGPLVQDGPVPTVDSGGGPCRFTLLDLASGQPRRQIAYPLDPLPGGPIPPGALAENGISEILMADARRMLVLERAFVTGRGVSLRLYEIDVTQASDTLALPALRAGSFEPARKTLLADFAQLGASRLDNTEGMCWGPRLPGGGRSLYFVSDDNFNPLQVTQFLACEFLE